MRIDLISVFPEFFDVLKLSLVGKGREKGIVDIREHNLRDWTDDKHRTVDDTPIGGGAGMVMKPDVWGRCIDELLGWTDASLHESEGNQGQNKGNLPQNSDVFCPHGEGPDQDKTLPTTQKKKITLAIPTPSGIPLTQKMCEELSHENQILIACGRYEGIDSRVAEHYRERGVNVAEYSLGDYVLNGGEVAAITLVEAVTRLIPGMMGNPESLKEESHGEAGLLEYNVYTRPTSWRGLEVDPVLLSGNHEKIARLRRDEALVKTAFRRPDMVKKLDVDALDAEDIIQLARCGFAWPRVVPHQGSCQNSEVESRAELPHETCGVSKAQANHTEHANHTEQTSQTEQANPNENVQVARESNLPKATLGELHRVRSRVVNAKDAETQPDLARKLAELAANTFPDACSDFLTPHDIDVFISQNLSEKSFETYLKDESWRIVVVETQKIYDENYTTPSSGTTGGECEAHEPWTFVAYTLTLLPQESDSGEDGALIAGRTDGAPVKKIVQKGARWAAELSKFYADSRWRGRGITQLLWEATENMLQVEAQQELIASSANTSELPAWVWLATNVGNKRAQKAYKKYGFQRFARRHFLVGEVDNVDVVLARPINMA